MKDLGSTRLAYLATDAQTDAECARIERLDGNTYGLTNCTSDLTISGVTYRSSAGYTPTAVTSKADLQPGTVDIEGIIEVLGVDRTELLEGLFDGARVYVFLTDYQNPVVDEHPVVAGEWGKVEMTEEGSFVTEFRSLAEYLQQPIGRTHTAACEATLGDGDCNVPLSVSQWQDSTAYTADTTDASVRSIIEPSTANGFWYECTTSGTSSADSPSTEPTWPTTLGDTVTDGTVVWTAIYPYSQTGTVSSVTSNRVFEDDSLQQADGWWDYGKVTWLTGNNAGLSMEVRTFAVSGSPDAGVITLFLPMIQEIQTGDTYTITVGCRKRFSTDCISKFGNSDNFRGFPHIPTQDTAGKFGGQ